MLILSWVFFFFLKRDNMIFNVKYFGMHIINLNAQDTLHNIHVTYTYEFQVNWYHENLFDVRQYSVKGS